jgi:Flp pilus assembly protein TadD
MTRRSAAPAACAALLLLAGVLAPTSPLVAGAQAAPPPAAPAPDEVNDLNERAKSALDAGKPAEAVLLLQKAVKLEPNEPVLQRNLAWAYFQRGQQQLKNFQYDEAADDYRHAVELHPEEIGYRAHLGQLLLRQYRLDESEKVLRAAVKQSPDAGDAWLLLGDVLSLQDELPEAIEAYDHAGQSDDASVAGDARTAAERARRQHAVEKDYRTDNTTYFTIRGPAQNQGPLFGVQLAGVLERARSEVCNALQYFPKQKTTVVLYPPDAFRSVTATHEWVGGLFDRKIRLPIADVQRDQAQIEASFRHEFTHLIVSEITPSCPTFVNEGLAQLEEFGRGQGLSKLTAYLDRKPGGRAALPRIGDLPASFVDIADPDTAGAAYLLSYAFIDHVASLHGTGAVMRWIKALANEPLAEAFESAIGRSLDAEEQLFRAQVNAGR